MIALILMHMSGIRYALQVDMGRDVRLRVSILVVLEDPVTEIQHVLRLEALLLTFPEDMPLSGVEREAGAAVKSTVQCVLKVNPGHRYHSFWCKCHYYYYYYCRLVMHWWSKFHTAFSESDDYCNKSCGLFANPLLGYFSWRNNSCGLFADSLLAHFSWQGTANDVSLRASRKREPHLLNFVAADEEIIEIAAPDADRDGGNPHLWSTLPVPIVEDQ